MQERRQHEIAQEEKKEDWLDKYEFHRCIFVEDRMINGKNSPAPHQHVLKPYNIQGGIIEGFEYAVLRHR